MPDITMCTGDDCPMKNTCYRYLATPSEYWQSYFACVPYANSECEHYWECEEEKRDE